jgi:ABC-2 type transport system permease protein
MQHDIAPLPPMLAAQTKNELVRLLRIPAFTVISIALPIMFYAFFGVPQAHAHYESTTAGLYILGSFSAYAVISIALFSFGASVAAERGTGATRLMRATPLRRSAYFFGKIVAALCFSAVTVALLVLFAILTNSAHPLLAMFFKLLGYLLLGCIPFIILGFAVGYLASINSAIAALNLINLPLAFASGLFVPLPELPNWVRAIAPYLPTYHYGQLAWGAVGAQAESPLRSFLWLGCYALVFLGVALRAYNRDERKEFA